MQIDHPRHDRRAEGRTRRKAARRRRRRALAAARAAAPEQPHPRHVGPDRWQFDAVVDLLRRLLIKGKSGRTMRASIERCIDDPVRVRLQHTADAGTAPTRRLVANRLLELLALRGRQR